MKQIVYIFIISLFVTSCTSRTIYKKPKNLIEKEKMINLWTDIYIAKGARTVKTKDLKKNINYIPFVLEKYKVDSTQFSESNIYYISRIDEYEKMFQEVENRLEKLKKKYQPTVSLNDSVLLEKAPVELIDKKNRKKLLEEKVKN